MRWWWDLVALSTFARHAGAVVLAASAPRWSPAGAWLVVIGTAAAVALHQWNITLHLEGDR